MELSTLVGGIAAVLTTTAFLPQVIRCLRTRDTAAISLWMYILIVAGSAMWFAYGLMLMRAPLIAANGITLVLSSIVLVLKIKNGGAERA